MPRAPRSSMPSPRRKLSPSSTRKKNALENNAEYKWKDFRAPRGTKDMLPKDASRWYQIERSVREVAELLCYGEIRTPAFENAQLFDRAVGTETDIVSKEMFRIQTRMENEEGESFALRPELTAPVVRAAIEHGLLTGQSDLLRLYYNSAASFRYEKPQKGRLRQFHQFGTELLGSASPEADAETIRFAILVFQKLGLSNFEVRLNTLLSATPSSIWRLKLQTYLREHMNMLSQDSQHRVMVNPMRVLDSKAPEDQEIIRKAPRITDTEYLSGDDKSHFESVQELIKVAGIPFKLDPF